MRIISGKLKGLRFNPPKGFPSRPTTDYAKEGLFNILSNELTLGNLEILDLFAGTGNITFELASREAGTITSIDQNFKCTRFIKSFAKEKELEDEIRVVKSDVFKFVSNQTKSYDFIFADPPFDMKKHRELADLIMNSSILKEDGLFILEHGSRNNLEDHPNFRNSRNYGGVIFSFFEYLPK